jgi:hypothetical protein
VLLGGMAKRVGLWVLVDVVGGVSVRGCWMERVWNLVDARNAGENDSTTTSKTWIVPADCLRISSKIKAGAFAAKTTCQQPRKQPWTDNHDCRAGSFLFSHARCCLATARRKSSWHSRHMEQARHLDECGENRPLKF